MIKKKTLFISFTVFFMVFGYFFFSYHYHPGLSVSFQGYLPKDMRGTLYWDYGNGYLEKNSIDLSFSSNLSADKRDLGKITIEPSGQKNKDSRGYLIWLIVTEHDFNNPEFIIDGRHHWGYWMDIKKECRGRQLALFPGSKIVLNNSSANYRIKFFKTPESGICKISSEHGDVQFYDNYGINNRWDTSYFNYHNSPSGDIKFVNDAYRHRFLTDVTLPHHKIYGIKFRQCAGNVISSISPNSDIILRPKGEAFPLVVERIQINGRYVKSSDGGISFSGKWEGDSFQFLSKTDFLEINGKIVSYEYNILSKQKENITVFIDNKESKEQIYRHGSDNRVNLSWQAPIKKSKIAFESILIHDRRGSLHRKIPVVLPNGDYLFGKIDEIRQNEFSWILLVTQMVTAGLLSVLFYTILSSNAFTGVSQISQLPGAIFIRNGKWLFWVIFLTGICSNLLWLLAEWPGSLTPDTVHVHSEVKRLLLTNHHPYLYSLFVLGLYNVYDSPLTIILFQLVTFYGVLAWWLYFIFRNGVKWFVILPLYFLTFLSIPVNLFNITVWKDIPYNTLVLYWAFFLTAGYFLKQKGRSFHLTISHLILLSFSFLFLCTFRHNGLIYLPVVPFLLVFFTRISRKWLAGFFVLSALLVMLNYLVLPGCILQDRPKKNDFAKEVTSRNLKQAIQVSDGDQEYYLEHYLAYRVKRFVATLGASPKASTWYNDMQNPPQRWFSVDDLKAEWIVKPKSDLLVKYKDRALETRLFKGFSEGRFLHWNSGFGLIILIAVLLLYKWLPLSAFYSSFFLIQAAGMFFVVWPRWRYLYFLYLGGMYLIFTLFLELSLRKNNKDVYDT